jgi:hypothetical protein
MKCELCEKGKAVENVNGYELCRSCFLKWLDRNEPVDYQKDDENLFRPWVDTKNRW